MIERNYLLNDGRALKYHDYAESIIDIPNGKIKYLTRSRETEASPDHVVLYVETSFTEWSPNLINYETAIAVVTYGELKQYGIVEPAQKTFTELQAEKTNDILSDCRAHIYAGYDSDALGAVHLYPCNETDQLNMSGTVQRSMLPSAQPTNIYLFLCADQAGAWEYRSHTATQIQKAGDDAYTHILNARIKNAQLQAQILAATTAEQLEAINW